MKLQRVAITGTPGTGKSTLAKRVSKKIGFALVDVNEFAKKHGLFKEKDTRRGSWIIDEKKLRKETVAIKGKVILEGHLSHFCSPDIAIVLRLNPMELKKRLLSRKWDTKKILENVEAEALGICLLEAQKECKKVFEIDTTGKSPNALADEAVDLICGRNIKKYKPGKTDWFDKLVSVLRESI